MRLIDADALIQKRNHAKAYGPEMYVIGQGYVMDAPTIDAVSVVRCKDCKHYNTIGCSKGFGWCESMDWGVSDDFYCANGKKLNKESEVK
jgi:hypothetical protein